ncbi:MAG TPA: hypothetical protein PK674_00225 [Candidatus Absconditabacterales bacterium]|nr:hypothetical protein [Candidatus Absconditabacterales bacterium]HOQ78788.1 hypothetical protein [Candidatus Absconditabacterales bacterium]HPK27603.1 hypothetical protein [Candidatus Absconditabacterales bacterium]
MILSLLRESKDYIKNNNKFIKLVFYISFGKLLYTLVLISYNINNLLIYRFDKGLPRMSTLKYFLEEIISNHLVWLVILIAFIILIGYVFLYPTGMSAIIHFLKDKKNSIGKAIGKGVTDFFVMFELNALAFSFGFYTYAITVLRLFTLGILDNTIAIILVSVWGLAALFSSIFWQYAKFLIVIENMGVFEAIKKSISITITNIGVTIRGRVMQLVTYILFYFKAFIIASAPMLLVYFLINAGLADRGFKRVIRLIGIITVILIIYMISIIQAFFRKFWFKMYNKVVKIEE